MLQQLVPLDDELLAPCRLLVVIVIDGGQGEVAGLLDLFTILALFHLARPVLHHKFKDSTTVIARRWLPFNAIETLLACLCIITI